MSENKKVSFSGVKPTGKLHLGNYLGALKLWVEKQDEYDNIFCVVNLHGLTVPEEIEAKKFKEYTRQIAAIYLASGIDPNKSKIFIQSQIPAHAELCWILNCMTPMGWLERMTQYKSKSQELETVGTGIFDYPALMAADILLYQSDVVPVGEDQKQHVELTRDIAQRFNSMFGEAFKIPQPIIRESGARIMGLDDATKKMSKSTGEKKSGHAIWLLEEPDSIRKSIMRAVTDTNSEVRYEFASPGVRNLLSIYEVITQKSKYEVQSHFEGKGYGFLKKEVAEAVVEELRPLQQKYNKIISDEVYLDDILRKGKEEVSPVAEKTLKRVKEVMGVL